MLGIWAYLDMVPVSRRQAVGAVGGPGAQPGAAAGAGPGLEAAGGPSNGAGKQSNCTSRRKTEGPDCTPATPELVEAWTALFVPCLRYAADIGFDIAFTPHLDDGLNNGQPRPRCPPLTPPPQWHSAVLVHPIGSTAARPLHPPQPQHTQQPTTRSPRPPRSGATRCSSTLWRSTAACPISTSCCARWRSRCAPRCARAPM